ncbi:hypothetical protein BDF20DRAFT_986143 [Mycotypha africana]|uniref:uncharacterized protein n=1 Tax=Mycotypha africana TaxID=64632 RepID=UPI0023001D15|nr:uncharacterized protein BDF20DRAFT_986143 [Mycotypha africana]KAI8984220.1 hypothetical protein BDF20DRAFT_986143 [Mycotypha africana]
MNLHNGGYLTFWWFAFRNFNKRNSLPNRIAAQYATLSKKRNLRLKEEADFRHAFNNKRIADAISHYQSLLSSLSQKSSTCKPIYVDRRTIGRLVTQLKHSRQKPHFDFLKRLVEKDMVEKLHLKPSHYEYHALMHAYGVQEKPITTAYALIKRMKEQGLKPNVYTYNTLLGCCKRTNNLEKAQEYFGEMEEAGIQPDTVTYNTMLHLLSKLGHFDDMFNFYSAMTVMPDTYTYSIMLDAAVKSKNKSMGLDIYNNLLDKTPADKIDLNTYNNMVRFAAAEVGVNEALDLYYRIQPKNHEAQLYRHITPDVFTFNIIIDACLKNRLFSRAYMIFRDMKERKVHPDVYTYGMLIDIESRKESNLKAAIELFNEMCSIGIKPNERVLNSLANLASSGTTQLADLESLLKITQRYYGQYELDSNAYNALLYGFAQHGRTDTVQVLYNHIKRKNLFQPDIITYTNLTLAFVNSNDIDTALQIYYTLRRKHEDFINSRQTTCHLTKASNIAPMPLHLDTIFYSTILSALSKKVLNSNKPVVEKSNTMEDQTSFTLNGYDDESGSPSRLSAALDLFNDMRPLRIQPTLHIYTTMVHLCGQYGDPNALHQIHQHIKLDLALDPDIGIYNALMDAYNRVGDGDTVLDIWQALILPIDSSSSAPISVDQTTVSIVLDSCGHNGMFQQAQLIWQFLKQKPALIKLNTNNYNSYIECLCRSKGDRGWKMAYQLMKEEMILPMFYNNAAAASSGKPLVDEKTINTLISFAKKKGLETSETENLKKLNNKMYEMKAFLVTKSLSFKQWLEIPQIKNQVKSHHTETFMHTTLNFQRTFLSVAYMLGSGKPARRLNAPHMKSLLLTFNRQTYGIISARLCTTVKRILRLLKLRIILLAQRYQERNPSSTPSISSNFGSSARLWFVSSYHIFFNSYINY